MKNNPTQNRLCTEPGCERPYRAKGVCSTHWNQKYRIRKKVPVECASCGVSIMKNSDSSRPYRYCSASCRADAQFGADRPGVKKRSRYQIKLEQAQRQSEGSSGSHRWISGSCSVCSSLFITDTTAIYCSDKCASVAHRDRVTGWTLRDCKLCGRSFPRGTGRYRFCSPECSKKFANANNGWTNYISTVGRLAIYERDKHICQLCFEPVDMSLSGRDRMGATLDHIKCVSWSDTPDHSPDNLRLAHRSCNSKRHDDGYRKGSVSTESLYCL